MGRLEYQSVLDFWFGKKTDNQGIIKEKAQLWWAKDAAFDAQIKKQFEPVLDDLIEGKLENWKAQPQGHLALIILADQFSRNMYRDDARGFSQDNIALALAIEGLKQGADKQLSLIERSFFYLPFEHAESLERQQQSVALYRALLAEADTEVQEYFQGNLDYAIRHQVIIERFGRYPHRNAILRRASTVEEIAFLQEPGHSF